jgi:hypothetical protein
VCKHALACVFLEIEEGTLSEKLLAHAKLDQGITSAVLDSVKNPDAAHASFTEDDHVRSRPPQSVNICCIFLEEIKDLEEDGFYCEFCGAIFCRCAVHKLFELQVKPLCPVCRRQLYQRPVRLASFVSQLSELGFHPSFISELLSLYEQANGCKTPLEFAYKHLSETPVSQSACLRRLQQQAESAMCKGADSFQAALCQCLLSMMSLASR